METQEVSGVSGVSGVSDVSDVDVKIDVVDENISVSTQQVEPVKKSQRELYFDDIVSSIMGLKSEVSGLYSKLKMLEKAVNKEVKTLNKSVNRSKSKGNRKPSGFAKSSKISDSLCLFMNVPLGTEVARTEVTKYIIQYIKDNNLQRPENKKLINPDSSLKSLLDITDGDELSYFNIQKYMNKHFV
jgi:chromatin remodeling complex protein RSC6